MKKSTMKMLALLLLAAMMLAAFTACGSNEAPSTNSVPPAETTEKPAADNAETEPITINFWHHYSAQSAENETLMNVLIPKFEEENPGIKVNAVSHEWADLHDKILVSASSNTLPDVARLDIAWVPEFQKMQEIVQIHRSPEGDHHVLGKHSAGLFAADSGVEQFVVERQGIRVLAADEPAQRLFLEIRTLHGGLTVVFRLSAQFSRCIEFQVNFRIAAGNLVVGPRPVPVPLPAHEKGTVNTECENNVLQRTGMTVFNQIMQQGDVP